MTTMRAAESRHNAAYMQRDQPAEDGPDYLRALYDGHRATTVHAIKSRFVGGAVRGSGSAYVGYDESFRNFLVENELRCLVDERIEAVPTDFSFQDNVKAAAKSGEKPEGDPGARPLTPAEDVTAWAECAVGPDGRDLWALFEQMRADQEIDGRAIGVMGLYGAEDERAGEAWIVLRDGATATPEYDQDRPLVVIAWTFEWTEGSQGGAVPRRFCERVDTKRRTLHVDGKVVEDETHSLGFLPVVVAPRRVAKGVPHGDSGILEMEEAYSNFLWASYQRNVANKYTAFRVWGPADETTAMALQGDNSGAGPSRQNVAPGSVLKLNLKPLGGDVDLSSIENQRRDSLDTLRRIGRGEQDQAERADNRVAKAAVVGRRGLQRYADSKCVFLKLALQQIATIRARLLGRIGPTEQLPVDVIVGDVQDADPTEQRERFKAWVEAYKAGAIDERFLLEQAQRLAMLDEDTDLEAALERILAKHEEEAAASMTRATAALQALPGGSGNADSPQPNPGDPPATEPIDQG